MSIPSNEKLASMAMKIAHEVYAGGACVECGSPGVEMHEIIRRQMRHILGAVPCLLGLTLVPLCPICHKKWDAMSIEKQIGRLQGIITDMEPNGYALCIAQRDQLIALKARCHVCK